MPPWKLVVGLAGQQHRHGVVGLGGHPVVDLARLQPHRHPVVDIGDTPLLSPVMMVKVPRLPLGIHLTEQAAPPRFPDEIHYHAVTPKTAYMPSRPL